MEDVMIGLTWLGFFAAAFLAWYYYLQARTKERTLLIEKGADASNFYAKKPERKGWKFRFPWMKFGLLLVGIAFGMGIGFTSTQLWYDLFRSIDEPFVFTTTVFFGGLAMIVAHFVDRPKQN